MSSQHQHVSLRSESSSDHLPLSDPLYNTGATPIFSDHLVAAGLHIHPEYGHDIESQKSPPAPPSAKSNPGLPSQASSRYSFTSFPNANRPRQGTTTSLSSFRENNSSYYHASTADTFPQHASVTSPSLAHASAFESRSNYDYVSPNGIASAHKASFGIDYPNGSAATPKSQQQPHPYPQSQSYGASVQIASQTPYGPHIPIVTNGQQQANPTNPNSSHNQNEDISTIFVVGFPDDMQEREFQNMFTFSSGFEAATLKIPNKEYNAYNSMIAGPGGNRNGSYPNQYGGSNDPYNLVTINQGGVIIDGGRDGTMSSWPPPEEAAGQPPFVGPAPMAPRKQIIGFAKFKSREAALAARDQLQGRRVDAEKGAVLKAEMAKKNLHTKRGIGPVGAGSASQIASGSASIPGPHSANMGGMGLNLSGEQYAVPPDQTAAREREYAYPGSLNKGGAWREHLADPLDFTGLNTLARDDDDRRRDREASLPHPLNPHGASRAVLDRAEEDEWERRRKEKGTSFLRGHNAAAYDAFHSVPHPNNRFRGLPVENNGFAPLAAQQNTHSAHDKTETSGRRSTSPVGATQPSGSYSPSREPELRSHTDMFTNPFPRREPAGQSSASSSSSVGAGSSGSNDNSGDATLIASEKEMHLAMNTLDMKASSGNTSPQLPSPSSNHSSVSTAASVRNMVDQNPPINTLYVGNLPTSSPPPGYPHDHLEDSLRELFSSRPGFRRLCFRHKPNGPMCFVEFEDVTFATRALNELYGNTLNGLVKGGGIRLSYSKNPLGVRTPTSAGSGPPTSSTPHHQFPGERQFGEEPRTFRSLQALGSPTQNSVGSAFGNSYMMGSPPPRFSAPSAFSVVTSAATFAPRSSTTYEYSLPSGHTGSSFSPFSLATPPHSSIPDPAVEHDRQRFVQGAMSPPLNHVEATRVG